MDAKAKRPGSTSCGSMSSHLSPRRSPGGQCRALRAKVDRQYQQRHGFHRRKYRWRLAHISFEQGGVEHGHEESRHRTAGPGRDGRGPMSGLGKDGYRGKGAPLEAPKSVGSMRKVVAKLGVNDSGKFFNYAGKLMSW